MHRRPDRKLAALIAALAALPMLGGCVQATRHSNTMVFGTNTTVGVKVGRDVNQMPVVLIAYDRQEAVIMPLLANTQEKHGADNLLSPCTPAAKTVTTGANSRDGEWYQQQITYSDGVETSDAVEIAIHPCKFVGIRTGKDNLAIQDSYSVLASFGARIEGDASDTKGTVGIAQYFATGVAAQTLAMTGGAAIVSVGQAAEKAAENKNAPASAAAALGADAAALAIQANPGFTSDPSIGERITELNDSVVDRISKTSFANLPARLAAFDSELTTSTSVNPALKDLCAGAKTSAECAATIRLLRPMGTPGLNDKVQEVSAALSSWAIP